MLNSRKYTFVAQLDVFNSEMAGRVGTKIYRLGWTIEATHVIARGLLRCVVGVLGCICPHSPSALQSGPALGFP